MAMMAPDRRATFGLNCVRCSNELVAPEKSEYWNEGQIRHLWHCPKCGCRFRTILETESTLDIIGDDTFPSLLET